MNPRTTENYLKYKEAKEFVKLYESEYNKILLKEENKLNASLWEERESLVRNRMYLEQHPVLKHYQYHIDKNIEEIYLLMKEKWNNKLTSKQ